MSATPRVVRLVGPGNQRMSVRMEPLPSGWLVYAQHPRDGRGASSHHDRERAAERAFFELLAACRAAGWQLASVASEEVPARMEIGPGGERIFRDKRTGTPIRDESCSRPAQTVVSVGEERPFSSPDAFSPEHLPRARR